MKSYFHDDAYIEENPCEGCEGIQNFPEKIDTLLAVLSCRQLKCLIMKDEKFFRVSARLSIHAN